MAAGDTLVDEAAVLVERLGSLATMYSSSTSAVMYSTSSVTRPVAVVDLAVRRFDKAVLVDAGIGRQVGDQADVRAFRGLDRAHTAVVAVVYVSDLEGCTVTGQAAGAQGGHTALVGQLGQRVGLVHELGQRGGTEELLDGRGNGADVDEGLRGDDVEVLDGHALADDALHAGKPMRNWFCSSSPTQRRRRLPRWSISSGADAVTEASR